MHIRIRELRAGELDRIWRVTAIERAPRVERAERLVENEERKAFRLERVHLGAIVHGLGAIRAIVCENEMDVAAVTQLSVQRERVNRGQIVVILAETVLVDVAQRHIRDPWCRELVEVAAPALDHSRRLIFPPRLRRRDFPCLRGNVAGTEVLLALPTLPRELVIVPHADERPARPRVLQIGIGKVRTIERAITVDVGRHVEIVVLLAMRVAHEIANAAVVVSVWTVLRIPHELVHEVAEVHHEATAIAVGSLLVLVDHPAIRVAGAELIVLAGDEREAYRGAVGARGSGDRAPRTTRVPALIDESIPVLPPWSESRCEHAAGPVAARRDRRVRLADHMLESRIGSDLRGETRGAVAVHGRTARPQEHAVGMRIARRDALRKEIPALGWHERGEH